MSYTALALVVAIAVVALDRWGMRTRLTSTRTWWFAYGIIVCFQLLANGWLTGRRIVRYAPGAIVGDGQVQAFGDGRILYAPVEDLLFGFGLVLTSCMVWVWLGRRGQERP